MPADCGTGLGLLWWLFDDGLYSGLDCASYLYCLLGDLYLLREGHAWLLRLGRRFDTQALELWEVGICLESENDLT
jgi:hypothetical protein